MTPWRLDLAEPWGVVGEPGLGGGRPLAGSFEGLAGAWELDFESGDPLFQFPRLRHLELVSLCSGGGRGVATQAGQRGMSVRKACGVVTSNNSRATVGF